MKKFLILLGMTSVCVAIVGWAMVPWLGFFLKLLGVNNEDWWPTWTRVLGAGVAGWATAMLMHMYHLWMKYLESTENE